MERSAWYCVADSLRVAEFGQGIMCRTSLSFRFTSHFTLVPTTRNTHARHCLRMTFTNARAHAHPRCSIAHTNTDIIVRGARIVLHLIKFICISFEWACTRRGVLNYLRSSWTQRVKRKRVGGFLSIPATRSVSACFHSVSCRCSLQLNCSTFRDVFLF